MVSAGSHGVRLGRVARLALCAALALSGCAARGATASSTQSEVLIGVSAAETGYLSASSDIPFLAGVRAAVSAINSAGGVDGRTLKLADVLDEQSIAATGSSNVNRLINRDQVDVVMSGSDSSACAAVQSVVTAAKVPMTCIAPPPAGSPYQFQVAASVPGMVTDMLGYLKSRHITTVALLSVTTVYGQIIARIISGIAASMGIRVAFTTTVPDSATDLTATMQRVKAAGVGAVVDSITGPEHIVEAKGAAAAGLTVPLVQITDTTDVFQAAAAAYPDLYFVTLPPQAYPHIPDPALLAAVKQFTKDYSGNQAQVAAAAYGWDAVHVLAAAIQKSGAITGAKLRDALETLTYQGVNSLFRYSAADHSGENSVPNPDSIGHFTGGQLSIGGQLTIVYNASSG